MDEDRVVRLLFVGDSLVGKSTILSFLCHKHNTKDPKIEDFNASSTNGCNAQVFWYEAAKYMVECVEVGGHPKYKISRKIFYQDKFDGIVFVYDLTRPVSYSNIRKWLQEVRGEWGNQPLNQSKNFEIIPKIAIGNKRDQLKNSRPPHGVGQRRSSAFTTDTLKIESLDAEANAGQLEWGRWKSFLDRVVEYSKHPTGDEVSNFNRRQRQQVNSGMPF